MSRSRRATTRPRDTRPAAGPRTLDADELNRLHRSCEASGVPDRVQDSTTLRRVARLLSTEDPS